MYMYAHVLATTVIKFYALYPEKENIIFPVDFSHALIVIHFLSRRVSSLHGMTVFNKAVTFHSQ